MKKETDTNFIVCMQHMQRQMFAAIKRRTFQGRAPPYTETPPISHLRLYLTREYTERAEINQEMQMKPVDSFT